MAINFPNSPVDGSTYTVSGTTYTYNLALGSWRAQVSGATGATAPSGSNTHVQYNNSGAFGGSAGLVFNNNSIFLIISLTMYSLEVQILKISILFLIFKVNNFNSTLVIFISI